MQIGGAIMGAKARIDPATSDGTFAQPTPAQRRWLRSGLDQPGGKLPLFDADGQRFSDRTVRSCLAHGWAEPWFANPLKPDWLVCKLTHLGRVVAQEQDD